MGLDAEKRGLVTSDDAFDKWAAQHTTGSILALRELCGLSQQDVADAVDVRLQSAKRWENPNTENGWYEPPEDAWAYLDGMRELMESQADFICERAIDLRDGPRETGGLLFVLRAI